MKRSALLTLMILVASSLAFGEARADSCTGLRSQLAERLSQARLKGHWPADSLDVEIYPDRLEAIPWRRVSEPLPLNDLEFISSAPSILGPECTGECRDCIHRKFFLDDDTLSFSLARVPEECSETPRLFWRTPSGDRHEEALVPLFNWNVDALWCIPHYVVFGLHADNEGLAADALVLWNLQTGTWLYAPSGTQYGAYFTGMSLPGLFPSWPQVDIAEEGDAVVLRGNGRFVALWPTKREWAILDPATGAAIEAKRRVSTHARVSQELRDEIHKAMIRSDPKAGSPDIMEVMSPACASDSSASAVLAHASTGAPAGDLYGVFLANSGLTRWIETLEVFPSLRYLDYDALFIPDTAPDSIIVIGLGDTYGDQMVVHRFGCRSR